MKRTVRTLMILVWITAVASCKKEAAPLNNGQTIVSSSSLDEVVSKTRFGILASNVEGEDRITVAQELGVSYVRDAIILQYYNGKAPMLDKYQSNGFKILLNLNYSAQKPIAFPTDMVNYRILVDSVLKKYIPEVAVIENEPANDGYYSSPIEDYFTELSNAITVCHAHDVKVADGALHTGMVCILVYQDYVNRGLLAKADDFASRALNNSYLRTAQGKGSEVMNAKLDKCKKMITAYKKLDLDYVNIHWYEPLNENNDSTISAPGVVKEISQFLIKSTGKQVLTNEFGQTNQTPTLVASQVHEFKFARLAYAIDYSGDSGGGIGSLPLNDSITLLPNGIAYRDAISK